MDIRSIGGAFSKYTIIVRKLITGHMDLALGAGDQQDLAKICLSFHPICMEDT